MSCSRRIPTRSRSTTSRAKPCRPTDTATPITARTTTTRRSGGDHQNSIRVGAGRAVGRTWAGRLNRRMGGNSRRTFAFCLSKRMKAPHRPTPRDRWAVYCAVFAEAAAGCAKRTHFEGRRRSWSDDNTEGGYPMRTLLYERCLYSSRETLFSKALLCPVQPREHLQGTGRPATGKNC
jgi:hypothetical protein